MRTFHIGHLVLWYSVLSVGIAYFFFHHFKNPLCFLIAAAALIACLPLYVDVGGLFKGIFRNNVEKTPGRSQLVTKSNHLNSHAETDTLHSASVTRTSQQNLVVDS
jgi:hypothetical protein